MAEGRRGASVRLRTTVGAVVVVAVALGAASIALVLLQRDALHDGVRSVAEERASALADLVEDQGLGAPGLAEEADEDDGPGEDDDLVVQVVDQAGRVVLGPARLPDEGYLRESEDAETGREEYVVRVAASLEDVEESTAALVPLLLGGVPLVLLVVGVTTWLVVGRALAPVERIRERVRAIGEDGLGDRVPVPAARDEVHRLATTMNEMLARLEAADAKQRRFVADASHELRSPIASLRQSAEVARAHPGALPEGELAETTFEESVRMQRLVDQLLLLSRSDAGGPGIARDEVDLDDLVRTVAARTVSGEVRVDTSQVSPVRVQGDEPALGQVVRNLLDNAARHATRTVRVGLAVAGGRAELTVDDDGPGVPPTERERVFDRFVRLDDARSRDAGGSGLGLAIVREVVAAHGGSVTVLESPTGGARLRVELPLPARS